jgi:leucine dehydrogenase
MDNLKLDYDLFCEAESLGVREFHIGSDPPSQLRAIIAIHSTQLGPALGGCRCLFYPSFSAAAVEAMRLARAMSYKAAITGVPYGGGKAVLLRPKQILNREAYFEAFGRFVEALGGRYITAEDSGTSQADMDIVAGVTRHVRGTSADFGDPAPYTALGVRRGIEAAVKFLDGRSDLEGLRVAVQGVGHVGYHLCRELSALGVRLTVADLNEAVLRRCAEEFHAAIISPDRIYEAECDVFAPCALGGVLNQDTVKRLQARVVAGSANNQLADLRTSEILHYRGILYVPDYVINAGGLIQLAITDPEIRAAKLLGIYDRLLEIFERARATYQTPRAVADQMAETVLYARQTEPPQRFVA